MAKNDVRSGKIDIKGIVASGELEGTAEIGGGLSENQIVVYQPNETVRLEVRLENETVWLTQSQMGTLFGCTTRNVRLHLENIYSCGELVQKATRKDFFLVRLEGNRSVHRGGVGEFVRIERHPAPPRGVEPLKRRERRFPEVGNYASRPEVNASSRSKRKLVQ